MAHVAVRGHIGDSWHKDKRAPRTSSADSGYSSGEDMGRFMHDQATETRETYKAAGKDVKEMKQDLKELRQERKVLTFAEWKAKVLEFLETVVSSNFFTLAVAIAILFNVLVMTLQVDATDWQPKWVWNAVWRTLNNLLMLFFTIELVLRMLVHGVRGFFCDSEDKGWNCFDFFVVSASWLVMLSNVVVAHSHVADAHGKKSLGAHGCEWVKLLRSVRMLRILRVLRSFKLPILKKLNTIVSGLISAFSTVMWIAVLLFTVMFVSSILCTSFIGHAAIDWGKGSEDYNEIRDCFGSMKTSFATLFQFLTLADWSDIVRLVAKQHLWMAGFLVIYICFAALVILSLLTGVVADHVNEVREQEDEEERADAQVQFKEVLNAEFQAFKQEVQSTGRPRINREHFRQILAKQDLRKELQSCDVDLDDFDENELFDSFNSYSDGLLSWPDFEKGMEEMRKGVEAKEIFKLEVSLQRAVDSCEGKVRCQASGTYDQAEKEASLEAANETARGINNQLDSLIASMDDYIAQAEALSRAESSDTDASGS